MRTGRGSPGGGGSPGSESSFRCCWRSPASSRPEPRSRCSLRERWSWRSVSSSWGPPSRLPGGRGDERDVLGDDDLPFLVVQREQVRRGKDVDVVPGLRRPQNRRDGRNLRSVRKNDVSRDPRGDEPRAGKQEGGPGGQGSDELIEVPLEDEIRPAEGSPARAGAR